MTSTNKTKFQRIMSAMLCMIMVLSVVLSCVACAGPQGEQGIQGEKGEKGDRGPAGLGIARMELVDGELIIIYTNGNVVNLGKVTEETDGTTYVVLWINADKIIASGTTTNPDKEAGKPADPTKASDGTYEYVFAGWEKEVIGSTITYRAKFDAKLIYTVNWVLDGAVVKTEEGVTDLSAVTAPEVEVRENTAQYTYTFSGWSDAVVDEENATVTYTASVTQTVNKYTITWVVDGNTTTEDYDYGATPVFKGSTDKTADAEYTYTFDGWDKELAPVTGTATYTAKYTATEIPATTGDYVWIPDTPVKAGGTGSNDGCSVELVEVDCSKYSSVTLYITHNSADSLKDKTNSHGAGLFTAENILFSNATSRVAYNGEWKPNQNVSNETFTAGTVQATACTMTFDLTNVDYNGMLYVAVQSGQWYRIHKAVFTAKEETPDEPTTPDTPEVTGDYVWTPDAPVKAGGTGTNDGCSVALVEVDCSKYSSVTLYITHNSADSLKDKTNSHGAGLFTAENILFSSATSRVAYNGEWRPNQNVSNETFTAGTVQATACTMTFDLTDVDYNGMLYIAVQSGQWYRIHKAVFTAK